MLSVNIIRMVLIMLWLVTKVFALNGPEELPLNIRQAYDKGTRAYDGKPGEKYWQNHADYKIDVTLVPEKNLIKGREDITYYNESPDTLHQLVIHLLPDLFKTDSWRDIDTDPADYHNGVDIWYLSIDDEQIDADASNLISRRGTNLYLQLENALEPREEIELSISWRYTLAANKPIRTGVYGDSLYFVAYWYPQIAVYDDIDGWDRYRYMGQLEFYSDVNNFDVRISVLQEYLVWATGTLENARDVLNEEVYTRWNAAQTSDSVINIVTARQIRNQEYYLANGWNVWHYQATSIPDFSFAVSDCYLWDATSLVTDVKSGRRTLVQAVYPENSIDFQELARISADVLGYASRTFPAVPYPFPVLTAVNRLTGNNGGGMEHPMMIHDGSHKSRAATIGLTIHEIGHQYLPFYVSSNEQKYAFMDEGWAHMLPFVLLPILEPASDAVASSVKVYSQWAGREADLPIMTLSTSLGNESYQMESYNKPGIALFMLREMLGANDFDRIMKNFIERWQGKHPTPYDLFFTFDDLSGQDLDWFWQAWYFQRGYPDLGIGRVEIGPDSIDIEVIRLGSMPVPVHLVVEFVDATRITLDENAAVWRDGKNHKILKIKNYGPIKAIELGMSHIPDTNPANNIFLPEPLK